MLDELTIPTGVKSSISTLHSLDEMLYGGLQGNWLLAGVSGIGKTTLAMSYLVNDDGQNKGKGAGILDYGMRQGQERYVKAYGISIADFHAMVHQDKERLYESAKALDAENRLPKNHKMSLGKLTPIRIGRREDGPKLTIQQASISGELKERVVKIDMHPNAINEDILNYFGHHQYGDNLPYLSAVMSAWLYHTFKVNGVRRFLIDGMRLSGDVRPVQHKVTAHKEITGGEVLSSERVQTMPAAPFIYYTEDIYELYHYFTKGCQLAIPFVGNNQDEFFGGKNRNYWAIDQPISTLTSLTLTGKIGENVGDIDDAVRHTQALLLGQEVDGTIVLGRNLNRRYAFADEPTKAAPPNTRMVVICKSRYRADETYREFLLDQENQRPVLGRVMVPTE